MRIFLLAALTALTATPALAAAPANTLAALFAQLNQCLSPMPLAPGTDVTVQFSLNRRGGLIGRPRITHAHWPRPDDAKPEAAAIAESFDRCLPAEITEALGGAIAGRQITYRLRGPTAKA
jgi:hypothetical protein